MPPKWHTRGQTEADLKKMLRIVDHTKYFEDGVFGFPNDGSVTQPFLDLSDGKSAEHMGLLGMWMLILKNWALCPGDGYLTSNGKKDGKSLSPADFVRLFRGSVEGFSRCLKVVTDFGMVEDTVPLYQIVDYERHFENYKSKTIERCSWLAMPNNHGGVGWCNLMTRPNGAAIYGIWVCLLQLCSRQRLPRCGYLTADGKRDGRRYSVSEMARLFRRPETEIRQCLAAVTRPEIDFIRLLHGEPETADGEYSENT